MEEKKKVLLTGIVFILVVAAVIIVYYLATHNKAPEATDVAEIVEEEPLEKVDQKKTEREPVEPIDATLEESDDVLRGFLENITSDPRFAKWMMTDHLIKNFVAAVDNIAHGLSPREQVDFFEPEGEFLVEGKEDLYIIDEDTYKRYNPVANVFESIDTGKSVQLYRRSRPLIQEAYKELGYPDADFDDTMERAIRELLAVPLIEEDIVLISKIESFELHDPELENLSQAQKHLLRMGPDNIRKIQNKLRELLAGLKQ